jgi:glutaredoxin-like protein NrdH
MTTKRVEGEKRDHNVFIYTLSTCGWCKKTKQFLKDNGVEYEFMDIDTSTREEKRAAIERLKEKGAPLAFPVIIVDDDRIISGFKQDAIREALGL